MMTLVSIPGPFADDTPFGETPFWQWALAQKRSDVTIQNYLSSIGFVLGVHRVSPEDYRRLEYAVEHFHWTAPRMPAFPTFSDAFTETPAASYSLGFYVQGREGRYTPDPKIIAALIDAGWIYGVCPGTTYFALIENRVYAKYQSILGSRFLFEILDPAR